MQDRLEREFRPLFNRLLSSALRRGVPFEDAEDLVQASIVASLDGFDASRGTYTAYCTAILMNRIRNYWRDRKNVDPVDPEEIPGPDGPDPVVEEEEMARMRGMIGRIEKDLTPEEAAFLKALGAALEEMDGRAISEAARRMGLKPDKGWDTFRRIQRKAKSLYPALRTDEEAAPPSAANQLTVAQKRPDFEGSGELVRDVFALSSEHLMIGRRIPSSGRPSLPLVARGPVTVGALARTAARDESFSRVMKSLSPDQTSRLRAFVS